MTSDVPFVLVVGSGGRLTGHGVALGDIVELDDDVSSWRGMGDLLDGARGPSGAASGTIDVPGRGPVAVVAHALRVDAEGGIAVVVSEPPAAPQAAEVARARQLVEQADAALEAREAELAELRAVAEHLLESSSVAAVIDERRRIRGWSTQAVRVWSVPAERAIGRPVSSVVTGIDYHSVGEVQHLETPQGSLRIVVEPLDDDERRLLVRLL